MLHHIAFHRCAFAVLSAELSSIIQHPLLDIPELVPHLSVPLLMIVRDPPITKLDVTIAVADEPMAKVLVDNSPLTKLTLPEFILTTLLNTLWSNCSTVEPVVSAIFTLTVQAPLKSLLLKWFSPIPVV